MSVAAKTPTPRPLATVADLLAIPEAERNHEIIDGELVEKEAATARHGRAQRKVSTLMDPYDQPPSGPGPGGWWILTETEIELAPQQVFRPDVVGWRRERLEVLPDQVPVRVRPDWVCEILSPRNTSNDLVKKKRAYHRSGVPHYWIVDPVGETLTVHRWTAEGYMEVLAAERGETVRAEPFDAIELKIGALFSDEP